MKRFMILIGLLLAGSGCDLRSSRRLDCINSQVPKYRACVVRVVEAEAECSHRHSAKASQWCMKSLPSGQLTKADAERHASACEGFDPKSELCLYRMRAAVAQEHIGQCKSEVRLGVRPWDPPKDFEQCRTERSCCTEAKSSALEDCDKAVRQAIQQCQ